MSNIVVLWILSTQGIKEETNKKLPLLYSTFVSFVKYICCDFHTKRTYTAKKRTLKPIKMIIKMFCFWKCSTFLCFLLLSKAIDYSVGVSAGLTMKGFALVGIVSTIASLPVSVFAQYQPYRPSYAQPSYRPAYTQPYRSPYAPGGSYSNTYQQHQINTLQQQQYRQQQINQSNSIRQTCIGGVGPGC